MNRPSAPYEHTQVGYLIIIAFLLCLVMCVWLLIVAEFNAITLVALLVLALALAIFSTLTVTVDAHTLAIRFGPGWVRKRWLLPEIVDVQVVRNPWYYGWGIHLTFEGWLFNVSGFGAVQITLRGGRRFRIGSDEPEQLAQALRQQL